MNIKYHRRKFEDDIVVSIEEFNTEFKYVIFDFFDSNEFVKFDPNNTDIFRTESEGFMVRLRNYYGKNLQENTYYSLSFETAQFWFENGMINSDVDSYLIKYEIDLPDDSDDRIFGPSISLSEEDNFELGVVGFTRGQVDVIDNIDLSGNLKVKVRNVGQANWNEVIADDNCKVVYDIGAPTDYKKSDLKKIIGNKGTEYIKSKPLLILSHWDKDHYHALLGMTDKEIKSFQYFIFRDKVPNLTSRIIKGRLLKILGVKRLIGIDAIPKRHSRYTYQLTPVNNRLKKLVLYNSEDNKNRNTSGLFMTLKSTKSTVVFSGDGNYLQVSRFILPDLNFPNEHSLIVPHHGGSAGKFEYKASSKVKLNRAVISVGINTYGHPIKSVMSNLKTKFKKTELTKYKTKDIVINL